MNKITAFIEAIKPYTKSVVGFFTPGIVLIGSAITDASQGGSTITQTEWITALVACFATGGIVYRAKNKQPVSD